MKKQLYFSLILILLVSCSLFGQEKEKKKSGEGFGLEVGVGYNSMLLSLKNPAGKDSMADLTDLWLQPCFRLHYDILLKAIGEKSSFKLKPFIGYYTFGGKHPADINGEKIILAFATIEAGVGLTFDINKWFQVSPLIKAQYIISAKERHLISGQQGVPTTDIRTNYNALASNAGLQIRFRYNHFTVGLEGWMGLTNFNKETGKSAKENNYRLLIGYEF